MPQNLFSDTDDLEEVFFIIEKSFSIQFTENELDNIKTFGELQDLILCKMQGTPAADCTTQQAFYQLRNVIHEMYGIDKNQITPDFSLKKLFPKKGRRKKMETLEEKLGVQLNVLHPPAWVIYLCLSGLIGSFILLFFTWKIGLLGLFLALLGFRLANYFGNTFDVKTLGQVAEKMTSRHYTQSRRNPDTFNPAEVEKVIKTVFADSLGIDEKKLVREAVL